MKAAILSGLVFPGIGQLLLGYKKRGWIIIAINFVFISLIIIEIINKTKNIILETQNRGEEIVIDKISSDLLKFSDNLYLNILLLFLVAGWLFSIIDAYRLPNKKG